MKKILYTLILFLCLSCTSTQEVIKKEYTNIHTIDTVIIDKFKYIKEKNDTIYIYDKEYVYKYRDRQDTLLITDTIVTIKEITNTEYVEVNKLKDWQLFLMYIGGGCICLFIYRLYNIFKKWLM